MTTTDQSGPAVAREPAQCQAPTWKTTRIMTVLTGEQGLRIPMHPRWLEKAEFENRTFARVTVSHRRLVVELDYPAKYGEDIPEDRPATAATPA